MEIKKLVLGRLNTNCYFIINKNDCIVVDSAFFGDTILDFAKSLGVEIKAVLLTHGHFDHSSACKTLQDKGIPVYVSEIDGNEIINTPKNMGILSNCKFIPDVLLKGDEELDLIGLKIQVIKTSGHTEGSLCYLIDNFLFSGDTLFKGAYGRCDFYSGDFNKIKNSIQNVLFKLDENIIVLTGHGEQTTIKEAKKELVF